jgi:hypothetical protein
VFALPKLKVEPFPHVDLRHMLLLTDETGILQHAVYATPDLDHGYCTDDVSRAAMAAVMALNLRQEDLEDDGAPPADTNDQLLVALQRYLAFLGYAFNPDTGRFRNFMGYDRQWLEEVGSEESHARTVWAMGMTVRLAPNDSIRGPSEQLLRDALPGLEQLRHIRPWAYGLLGMDECLKVDPDHSLAVRLFASDADRLFGVWQNHAEDDWPWWEDRLTWGNAKLPHALLVSGCRLRRDDMIEAGLKSLRWLLEVQTADDGHLSIVGNKGWFIRDEARARFDQQPIDAHALVQACLAAAQLTGDKCWADDAVRCFEWFRGRNDVGVAMYDAETGGCQNGLMPDGANPNQGAESTLAYVLSVLDMHHYRQMHEPGVEAGSTRSGS